MSGVDVVNSLARIREEINRSTEYIEKLQKQEIESTKKTIQAINDLLRSQQETELAKTVASMASKTEQLEYERRAIDFEQVDLTEKIDKVVEHYLEVQSNLDKELDDRIRMIGKHIFTIVENEGQAPIDEFDAAKLEAFDKISERIKKVYSTKIQSLEAALGSSLKNIEDFRESRRRLVNNIHSILIDKSVEKPVRVYVPYWVVKIQDGSGETKTKIYGPGHVSGKDGVKIEPHPEFANFQSLIDNKTGTILNQTVEKDKERIKNTFKKGVEKLVKMNLVSDSVAKRALKEEAISDISEIKIEGGK